MSGRRGRRSLEEQGRDRGRHSRMTLDDLQRLYWSTEQTERDLVPLALFRGSTSLGEVQAMWNTAQVLREEGIETCADAGRFVRDNADISHAAGLHLAKADPVGSFGNKLWKLTNRVFSAPGGVRIDAETSEYLRYVMHNSRRPILSTLRPIDQFHPYSQVAWRRPRPLLIGPDLPVNPKWPFLKETHTPDIEGMDLLTAVDTLVPTGLPPQLREDVCQDVVLGILEGELVLENLKEPGAPWLKDIFRKYRMKYGTISLDAPPPWAHGDGRTLGETLAAA